MSDRPQYSAQLPTDAAAIRQRAEVQVRAMKSPAPAAQTPEEIQQMVHELRVHQIELEMQNEELRTAQAVIEAVRARYFDLYDLAPVGYCTVSEKGLILEANLTAATLLGTARSALVKQPLSRLIFKEDQDIYYLYHKKLLATCEAQECDLRLVKPDGAFFWVHLTSTSVQADDGAQVYCIVFSDITERMRAEELLRKSEEKHRNLSEDMPVMVCRFLPDFTLTYVNRAYSNYFDKIPEELIGLSYLSLIPEAGREAAKAAILALDSARQVTTNDYQAYAPDGSIHWQRWTVRALFDDQDNIFSYQAVGEDISERKQTEDELRIAAVAFSTQNGMVITDPKGVILQVNPAFTLLTGYSAAEAVGKTMSLLHSGRHDPLFYQRMWQTIKNNGHWQGEIWNRRKNGQIYAEIMSITAVVAPERGVTHYVGNFTDITGDKEAVAEIHRLAYYDPLTDLPNRRLLQDRLGQAVAATSRSGLFGAMFFIDLDHFKKLNDTRGHDAGDQLLVDIAQRLKVTVRDNDTVARQGGDEFVVLVENLGRNTHEAGALATHLGEKLRAAFDQPFILDDYEYKCNISIGVALFHVGDTVEDLFKHADLALYQAKNSGRNMVRFFETVMQADMEQRSALESELHKALERQELRLDYQLQVDSKGCPNGVEALLRWQHPQHGLVLPNDFIPLAEETGLILPIGMWVLETACAQLAVWAANATTCELHIAVNVSARQFCQSDFVAQVQQVLAASGAASTQLKLELTESMMFDDIDNTIKKMTEIKRLGVSFAMDDFGTGYSSLAYLAQLPIDQLKIDKSFVRNLPGNKNDETIARTIIGMGRGLGMDVIAEGIETEVQRHFLEMHGCHAYQGYLFSRPIPIEELDILLLHHAGNNQTEESRKDGKP